MTANPILMAHKQFHRAVSDFLWIREFDLFWSNSFLTKAQLKERSKVRRKPPCKTTKTTAQNDENYRTKRRKPPCKTSKTTAQNVEKHRTKTRRSLEKPDKRENIRTYHRLYFIYQVANRKHHSTEVLI